MSDPKKKEMVLIAVDAFREFLNQENTPILSIGVLSRYDIDPSYGKIYIKK